MTKALIHIPNKNLVDLIGNSVEMKEIINVIQQVAPTDITVLVTGESGVGKEVVARAIHSLSSRASKPMLTVNCGAIPEGIIESELFGHEKGSFTGANQERKGYFELADGGTIFLDEIGELPLATQVKFLRVLENGEFLRVGSSTSKKVNVRVIAATNKNLANEVKANRFRTDLYFRLRSINIHVLPLRERSEDISLLAKKFAQEFAEKNHIPLPKIEFDAIVLLKNYYWPGNIRELKNLIESLLVLERGKSITAEAVNKHLNQAHFSSEDNNLPVFVKQGDFDERGLIYRALVDLKSDMIDLKKLVASQMIKNDGAISSVVDKNLIGEIENLSIEDMERKLITHSLEKFHGSRRNAARALKISERTLYRKIKEFGLQ
ncbi:MAG: sigma-54 dependent transcriptional regulator [Bacteroidota bacterium]